MVASVAATRVMIPLSFRVIPLIFILRSPAFWSPSSARSLKGCLRESSLVPPARADVPVDRPLDDVSRLLVLRHFNVSFRLSFCDLSFSTDSRQNLARILAYANTTWLRPVRVSPSMLHLMMFRVCFFISVSFCFVSNSVLWSQCLRRLSPESRQKSRLTRTPPGRGLCGTPRRCST